MSADTKYNDSQVRANWDEFYRAAHAYLVDYKGEFEFLISCKMRIASDIPLTIGMVRGVLNCMRVDARVVNLPEPVEEAFDADVIPMREPRYVRPAKPKRHECMLTEPHTHTLKDWEYLYYCEGIHAINRAEILTYTPAKIKPQYIFCKGKSVATVRVHLCGEAEYEHEAMGRHEPGYRRHTLIVQTACGAPYHLKDPLLLTVDMVAETDGLERCPRCFPHEDTE